MDRHYSTLELVKYDETAQAPQRDYDATAFELDASALAPQVCKNLYVTRSFSNRGFRLYLIPHHKCSMMLQLLRLMRRIIPKNMNLAPMSSSLRSNGFG